MTAVLALVFFVCFAGSMASDARNELVNEFAQQGQAVARTVFSLLQQQVLALVQAAVAQLGQIGTSLGRLGLLDVINQNFESLFGSLLQDFVSQLAGFNNVFIFCSRASIDLSVIFNNFYHSMKNSLQGLSAVLGGIGDRKVNEIFFMLSQQLTDVIAIAQDTLQGAINNLITSRAARPDDKLPPCHLLIPSG